MISAILGGFAAFFNYSAGILISVVSLLGPPEIVGQLMFFTIFGSITRVALAAYLKYEKDGYFRPAWKRIGIELSSAAFFGSIGAWLMASLGTVPSEVMVGGTILAFVGGMFGPFMILKAVEAFGAEKMFEDVAVSAPSGLTERQRKALTYAREYGRITNKDYRKMNNVKDTAAYEDLAGMQKSGLLRRSGSTKGVYYEVM